MLKLKDYILLALVAFGIALIYRNDRIISKELEEINRMEQTQQIKVQEDYLIPAPKERVEAVILEYYTKVSIVPEKTQKAAPTVKIKPKNIKPKKINLKNQDIIDQIAVYIKKKEGFRAQAYKDNTQYSNGYGTAAKSKTEIITVKEANTRLYTHIKTVIIPSLQGVNFQSIEQVYSAIDFSYNLGHNRFRKNIVQDNGYIDCSKMMKYNKMRDKDGNLIYNEGLAQRRLENFLACSAYEIIND